MKRYGTTRVKIGFCFMLTALGLAFPVNSVIWANAADQPYLEGTMYDTKNPKDSVAMINGQPYKAGDVIGEYVVADIYANGVKLKRTSTGEEKSLVVGEDESKPLPESTPKKESMGTGIGKFFTHAMGKKETSDVGLRPALQSLRKALLEYRSEVGRFPETIAILAQEGRINPNIVDGVGDYQFYFERLGQTFTLYAEPRSPSEESYYYFMDDIGRLRIEKGKRANERSEMVEL